MYTTTNQALKIKAPEEVTPQLELDHWSIVFLQPAPLYSLSKKIKMKNHEKTGSEGLQNQPDHTSTAPSLQTQLINLQEKHQHLKTLGEVFMFFIAEQGRHFIVTSEELDRLTYTYNTAVHAIEKL